MGKLPPPPLLKHLLQRSGKSDLTWADWYQKVQAGIITGAPTDASYVTTKANSSLSGEINLGALASGFVQSAASGGVATLTTTPIIPPSAGGTGVNLGALASGFLQSTASGGVATLSTTPIIPQSAGGTGKNTTTATDGQLLIGRSSDHSLNLAALVAGTGISVTNGPSSVTIVNTSPAPTTTPGQIPFPAVQNPSTNPNTLDDYEEGTWTPFDNSGAFVPLTLVGPQSYVKIGQLVIANALFYYAATGSTAIAVIGGLPYTSDGGYWACPKGIGPAAFTGGVVFPSGTSVDLYNNNAQMTNNLASGVQIAFTAIYRAAN
jgi:hypothetical protein